LSFLFTLTRCLILMTRETCSHNRECVWIPSPTKEF
jgi:hypothetical protein